MVDRLKHIKENLLSRDYTNEDETRKIIADVLYLIKRIEKSEAVIESIFKESPDKADKAALVLLQNELKREQHRHKFAKEELELCKTEFTNLRSWLHTIHKLSPELIKQMMEVAYPEAVALAKKHKESELTPESPIFIGSGPT
jgi:hypothetical protein